MILIVGLIWSAESKRNHGGGKAALPTASSPESRRLGELFGTRFGMPISNVHFERLGASVGDASRN
jgi:hypothetical protein